MASTENASTESSSSMSREDHLQVIRRVADLIDRASTFSEIQGALNLLPPGAKRFALISIAAPELSRSAAVEMDTPAEDAELFQRISSKTREIAEPSEIEALVRGLAPIKPPRRDGFSETEDPLVSVGARTFLDVLDKKLKIRIMGGPSESTIVVDFTKDLVEVADLSAGFLRWSLEALEETKAVGLDPADFTDPQALGRILDALEKTIRSLREIVQS